jgi:hypothetical protein
MDAGREEGLLPEAARVRWAVFGEGEVWLEKSCRFAEEDKGVLTKVCCEAESSSLLGTTLASWCGLLASTGDDGEWLHCERKLDTI